MLDIKRGLILEFPLHRYGFDGFWWTFFPEHKWNSDATIIEIKGYFEVYPIWVCLSDGLVWIPM